MNNINITISNNILIVTEGGISDTFTIVEKVPQRYGVWPIGQHMGTDEYIPFCEPDPKRGPFSINPNTLLTVKLPVEEVLLLRKVASIGGTVQEIRESMKDKDFQKFVAPIEAKKAIAILERIMEKE